MPKSRHVRPWGSALSTLAVFFSLGACNSSDDNSDGQGGAPSGGTENGAGGEAAASGGRKPTSGGAPSGGSDSGSSGGRVASADGGRPTGGDAGAPSTGGAAPTEPAWIAFRAASQGAGNPLLLLRSDGSSEPLEISEGILGQHDVSWAADGRSLLFVEYGCCGETNAAFELPVEGDEIGTPVAIHPPLPTASLIHYAKYSPNGAHILARLPEPADTARYALRTRAGGPTDWQMLTPASVGSRVDVAPAWSPDSGSVLMVQGDRLSGQQVYRYDVDSESTAASEILSLPSPDTVQQFLWSADSQHFLVRGEERLYLGSRDSSELYALAGPEVESSETGQGGEDGLGGTEPPRDYGGFQPLAFSPDSQSLVYGSYDEGIWRGSMRLTLVELDDDVPVKTVLLESPNSLPLRFSTFSWPEPAALFVSATVAAEGRFDVVRIHPKTGATSVQVRLPEGHMTYGFAWVSAGILQHSDTDFDYVPDSLTFTPHGGSPDASNVLFQFEPEETPNWSSFANASSPRVGGFFSAVGASESGSIDYRLWHYTPAGTLELVAGPLPEFGNIVTDFGALDPLERRFVFSLDTNGDEFYEVALSKSDGERFGEAEVIADLSDYPGVPEGFVWQP